MRHPTAGSEAFSLPSWITFFRKSTPAVTPIMSRYEYLHRLDDFLVQQGLETLELPRSLARNWLAKKEHESASTQQIRITVVRQFSSFLLRAGYPAYVPDSTLSARKSMFVPRMLTDEELRNFFHAVDELELRRGRLCGTSLCRKFSGSCTDAGFVSEKC